MTDIPLYSIPEGRIEFSDFKLYAIKSAARDQSGYPGFPQQTNVPHRHDFFEVCVFFKGSGTHEIDFQAFPIQDHSIHFVSPGQVHLITNHEEANGFILAFSEEFIALNRKLTKVNISEFPNPFLNLSADQFEFVHKILEDIMYEYSHPRPESEEIIKSYLYIFILKAKSLYSQTLQEPQFQKSKNALFRAFVQYVEENYLQQQQVSYYADLLHISPSHLNKVCKKECGKTASDFVHDRVMLEAKRLLVFSDKSSKEIAYSLQYEDPSYFSRIFKKKTGYSPTAFRKMKLEKYQPKAQ